jgi:hypothetical protein
MDVTLQQPTTLDDAFIFARAYERCNASHEMASTPTAAPTAAVTSGNKPTPSSIRLSLSEIAQRRKDSKCFKCDELFTTGHRQQ